MAADVERVELGSETDLRQVLEQVHADGVPRVIERHGEAMVVIVHPGARTGASLLHETKSRESRKLERSLAREEGMEACDPARKKSAAIR